MSPTNPTLQPEVTHISSNGVWLLASEEELFMPYSSFPWFKEKPVSAILNVEECAPGHFYWPDLDVDLTADMIKNPASYPLRAKG